MGYRNEQIETYRSTLNRYIGNIPNAFIRTRRTDKNVKIAPASHGTSKNVGKWAIANTTFRGNGGFNTD